ncbi:glucose/sorbosone dehydrogenase [Cupriavidus necator N-1]|uniref:Glucose/sorbosone dehydrogenase n=1 Tax=Cupriavidus necator (strain ATCC 43291 / DSM 13513 / CCUG 52238 / LMG 8453 / N-1) TaxID=1042878 RepID=G0EYB9_CUPNN|nr:glucose/sorbosone dehydrogenase [Cupriavidus necator N-1]
MQSRAHVGPPVAVFATMPARQARVNRLSSPKCLFGLGNWAILLRFVFERPRTPRFEHPVF